jgi:hypothetical protein
VPSNRAAQKTDAAGKTKSTSKTESVGKTEAAGAVCSSGAAFVLKPATDRGEVVTAFEADETKSDTNETESSAKNSGLVAERLSVLEPVDMNTMILFHADGGRKSFHDSV